MTNAARVDYDGDGITEEQLAETPWKQARLWVDAAIARQEASGDVPEPVALSVATVDAFGAPNVRTVLMRFFDERGPGFVSSSTSTKGEEMHANPQVAAALTWPSMFRAIRFRGTVELVPEAEVTAYWQSRPWGSRISAWASAQSQPIEGRDGLEQAYERYAAQWPDHGQQGDVPRPEEWVGYRVNPIEVEFWGGRRNRLHDRLVFTRVGDGSLDDARAWTVGRRQP